MCVSRLLSVVTKDIVQKVIQKFKKTAALLLGN